MYYLSLCPPFFSPCLLLRTCALLCLPPLLWPNSYVPMLVSLLHYATHTAVPPSMSPAHPLHRARCISTRLPICRLYTLAGTWDRFSSAPELVPQLKVRDPMPSEVLAKCVGADQDTRHKNVHTYSSSVVWGSRGIDTTATIHIETPALTSPHMLITSLCDTACNCPANVQCDGKRCVPWRMLGSSRVMGVKTG